jgi:cellulose synthase/poly-beta-1,6-N-acetylglucosamine synthase-like glycosyltransferase
MIAIILICITLIYVIQIAVVLLGLRRTRDRRLAKGTPFVSVVIAARDEEKDLPRCLESLVAQTYPANCYEVIIANDHSSDGTGRICQEFCRTHARFSTFVTRLDESLRGKPNALAQAIEKSRGEIVLITDADCVVPTTWVEKTALRYSAEVGLVGGMTLQKADTSFHGMQSLDWAYILGVASASAAFGNPLGSIGNNLSFRKEAYEQVGGYRKLKFSVTEDYTLVQAILKTKKWEFLYPIDPDILVESQPCSSLKLLIQQKHRWGKGGLHMKLMGFFVMAIAFAMHAAIIWSLLVYSVAVAGTMFLVKFIADYSYLYQILARLKRTDELKYFFWFELYYVLYVLILPFLVFFGGRVSWKGRRY